ncbi:uncharacterized protein YukE [Mycobacterium sp. OAS707]|uniref:hypothetical protein n=1 Tax=Mycobacterium sp. OAS707 TaxID=2663822 RepID=UPI00178B8633|nr:uncharacterized protein YukE [Mycobacterium sp. OAS707]
MAEKLDVAARLAEGLPAVDNVQTCVWACQMLGYTNPDLTLHAAQVRDWYGSEDGLDLRALDADCAALEAAVAATEDALARQDIGALSTAWQGDGADASTAFLRRHGQASEVAAAAVRTSADALADLRDNLWKTVDQKVAAAIDADGRAQDDWVAAARTVTTGAGDRAAASEKIDQEVKPFVDNDIRIGWLTAMRSATAAVTNLYDTATAELTAEPDAVFDVPGDLGPSWTPPQRAEQTSTVPAAFSAPPPPVAAPPLWSASAVPSPAPTTAEPMPPPPPAPPPVDAASTAPAMAAPPSAPSLGGMPDLGSGLSGFGQQLADAFGSLLGSADAVDTPGIDDPEIDEPGIDDELDDETEDDDEPVEPAAELEDEPAAEEPVEEPVCQPAETPVEAPPPPEELEPAPTPVPEPPPDSPPPEPVAAETPCEIAADELPQVGE